MLKVLKRGKGPGSAAYQRFVREVQIVRSLSGTHPGIVPIEDAFLPEAGAGTPYIVMPEAESTLARVRPMLAGASGLERLLGMAVRIAEALQVAHQAGVVHRDVKPENILLFGVSLDPCVADFGIALLVDDDAERLTAAHHGPIGSRGFTPPELETGGQVDEVRPSVDVYALGKTLYNVASDGRYLARDEVDEAHDLARTLGDPRLEHLMALVRRMVARNREDRYQTMTECAEHMRQAIENVKRGVACEPRMYGGTLTPAERFDRTQRAVDAAPARSVKRGDVIREAIRISLDDARRLAEEAAAKPDMLAGAVSAPIVPALKVAEQCAENMMSAGLALVLVARK